MNRDFRARLRMVAPEFDDLEKSFVLSIRLGDALKSAARKATTIKAGKGYITGINRLEIKARRLSAEIKNLYQNLITMELTE